MLGDELKQIVEDGDKGLNKGYRVDIGGVPDLIRGAITTILGGTGSGKSMLATLAMSLGPLHDWYRHYRLVDNKPSNKIFHLTFFSFEMSREDIILRMASYLLAMHTAELQPANVIGGYEGALSDDARTWLLNDGVKRLNVLSPYITIKGKKSPDEIQEYIKDWYKSYGEVVIGTDGEPTFIPNDNKIITHQVVIDHVALLRGDHKKSKIDALAEIEVDMASVYKVSFLNVQQLNRSEGSIEKLRTQENPQPTLSEAKDSGDLIDASKIVLALYNPYRFSISQYLGYDIISSNGEPALEDSARFIFLLKRRYGKLGWIPTAFYGEAGMFQELPEPRPMRAVKDMLYYDSKLLKEVINRKYWIRHVNLQEITARKKARQRAAIEARGGEETQSQAVR